VKTSEGKNTTAMNLLTEGDDGVRRELEGREEKWVGVLLGMSGIRVFA